MRRLAIALAAWIILAAPALAAITVPGNANIGTHYQASGQTTNVVATGTDAPSGSLIVAGTSYFGTTTISSVVDSAGNCSGYSSANSAQTGSKRVAFYYCNNTGFDLPIGGTITTTFVASAANMGAMAFLITGASASPLDALANASTSGTSAGMSGTPLSSTPGTSGSELVVACVGITGAQTGDNYVEDASWTAIAPALVNSSNLGLHCAYRATSSTSTITWGPTWTNSRAWTAWSTAFKAPVAATAAPKLMLLGVGQ